MVKTFRDALLEALEANDATVAQLARETGVSKDQIHKVKQGKSRSTNVDDARKIAAFFGMSLDQFLDDQDALVRSEIVELLSQLSQEERDVLLAAAKGVAARGHSS